MYGKSQIAVHDVEGFRRGGRGRLLAPHCVTCCCLTSAGSQVKCSTPVYLQERGASCYGDRCDSSKSKRRRGNSAAAAAGAERNVTTIDDLLRELNMSDEEVARGKEEDTLISETQEEETTARQEDSTMEKRATAFGSYYSDTQRGQSKVTSAHADSARPTRHSCEPSCPDNRHSCRTPVDAEQKMPDEQIVSVTRTENIGCVSDKAANEHQHSTYLQYSREENCRTSPLRLAGAGDRNHNAVGFRRGDKEALGTTDRETDMQTPKIDIPPGLDHEEHVRQLKLARCEFIQRISEEVRKLERLQRYLDGCSPPRRRNKYRRNVSTMTSANKMPGENKSAKEF